MKKSAAHLPAVSAMTLTEKVELLREEPIFWSRFGIEYDQHRGRAFRHRRRH